MVNSGIETNAIDAAVVPEEFTFFTSTLSRIVKVNITSDTSLFILFVACIADTVFTIERSIGNAKAFILIMIES